MTSNFITFNIDLSNIFVSGSSPGVTTGYTLLNGNDISTIFNPYIAGDTKYKATGFLTSGGFDLSDLFSYKPPLPLSISGCSMWLDANDASTLTLVSNKVSKWNDKSPNLFYVYQDTSTSRPTYDTTTLVNGKPTLSFSSSFLYGNTTANNITVGTDSYSLLVDIILGQISFFTTN